MSRISTVRLTAPGIPCAVSLTESLRASQITARLLAERCPGHDFDFVEGNRDAAMARCHPSITDCARSHEVQRIIGEELSAEARENPRDLPKWHIIICDTKGRQCPRFYSQVVADHDFASLSALRAHRDFAKGVAVFGARPQLCDVLTVQEAYISEANS